MNDDLLQSIATPDDLRAFNDDEMAQLAAQIRAQLIAVTAQNGGHLASSLGAVEIILALHRVFDFSKDRLVFDVGHQSYAHKLITGRLDSFGTLRCLDGVCGFPRRDESIYDTHDAGHASDSLSIATGLALTRDLNMTDEHVAVLIGDAALSGGMAFEALNQIGHEGTSMTIVLNDNEMSISRNVGALSLYLGKARLSKPYTTIRDSVEGGMGRTGRVGRALVNVGEAVKGSFKKLVVPGTFFEDMGIKYLGPIDGHNIGTLENALQAARGFKGPVLIHAVTQKGKGYGPAEQRPDVFHGVGRFDPATGEVLKQAGGAPTFTKVFSQTLLAQAATNPDLVAVTAAMTDGTGLDAFKEQHPQRTFDVGIAEEHAVALAAGLALGGKLPVVAIYSTFLQRAFDQMVINVALQQQHVVFCVDRAGLVGEDGSTHHGIFDLAYLRAIPHMRILAPSSAGELASALHTALLLDDGPVAIRYSRGEAWEGEGLPSDDASVPQKLPIKKALKRRDGEDAALLAVGRMVPVALEAAALLACEGVQAAVWDMRWVKPVDREAVAQAAQTPLVVTLEEGTIVGGFGSAVLEALALREVCCSPRTLTLGLPDAFVFHGSTAQLFEDLGLTAPQIAATIQDALGGQDTP
jgi:1-deoxy-D-xylulose-5-phosphate synthase